MDAWMDGGWMGDGWMDGKVDGWTNRLTIWYSKYNVHVGEG